jgi:hypothetical protein
MMTTTTPSAWHLQAQVPPFSHQAYHDQYAETSTTSRNEEDISYAPVSTPSKAKAPWAFEDELRLLELVRDSKLLEGDWNGWEAICDEYNDGQRPHRNVNALEAKFVGLQAKIETIVSMRPKALISQQLNTLDVPRIQYSAEKVRSPYSTSEDQKLLEIISNSLGLVTHGKKSL